jgi:hypothetical protein
MAGRGRSTVVYLSNLGLFSTLVTLQMWILTIAAFLGKIDPTKRTICHLLTIAATVFFLLVGRKAMGGHWPVHAGQRIGVSCLQACWVALLMIAMGGFYAWLYG